MRLEKPSWDYVPETEKLFVKATKGKGRGVFAKTHIKKGEIIECCPVIPLDLTAEQLKLVEQTDLQYYVFDWRDPKKLALIKAEDQDLSAIILGYGMLYNHSDKPNANFYRDYDAMLLVFSAISDIFTGQEICYDYNVPIWFKKENE